MKKIRKAIGLRRPALIAAAACLAVILTQVPCFAAFNSVPAKMFPSVTGVEVVWENSPSLEMHIRFTNNVSAIDEEQVRAIENPPDGNYDYMIGINERNLTKFHLVAADEPDVEVPITVTPHPQAQKQTEESRWFYVYAEDLDVTRDYEVHIDEDLYANMGNSLGVSYTITFNLKEQTCDFAPDGPIPEDEHTQAPLTLDMMNIENNEKDVPPDLELQMRFSFNVSGSEIFEYNVTRISLVYADDESKTVPITVRPGSETQEISVAPVDPLESGTEYRLIIAKEFSGRNGVELSSPLNIYFTVIGEEEPGSVIVNENENILVECVGNGTVVVETTDVLPGDTVTVSATPKEGFLLDSIAVRDGEGNEIELTEQDEKYTFTMPDPTATIQVTFAEEEKMEDYFPDIEANWAREDINMLADLGVVTGTPDGLFLPGNKITRAEVVTILVRLCDLDSETTVPFADTQGHWASGYISIAAALGYVNGFDADTFGPDQYISREQMAVILSRIAEFTPDPAEEIAPAFTDAGDISDWAVDGVTAAFRNGIVNGYPDGSFLPLADITRAEACHMIVNLMESQRQAAE